MKTNKRSIVTSLVIALAIGLMFGVSAVQASIITFDGKGTNVTIPDTFGDDISSNGTGYNISNGATPNIDLTWNGVWDFYNDSEWSAGQLQGYDVGVTHEVVFTPDSGYQVNVDSFVFDDYAGYAQGNKFNWIILGDGSELASGTETTSNGQDLTVTTGMGFYEGIVTLRIEEHSDNDSTEWDDQAIDNLSFTQQIPEPASLGLLGLFGAIYLLRRRLMRG